MGIGANLGIPKEHGAWGMLYVPLVAGALVAGAGGWRFALLTAAVTFLFVGRESVLRLWRARARGRSDRDSLRRVCVYLLLASASGAPLIWVWRLRWMAALGGAALALLAWNAVQVVRREERTMFTEVLGIAGLTLTAPAAHYAGRMEWTSTAWWLWCLHALYFSGSVFYVRLRVRAAHPKGAGDLTSIRWLCGAYHLVLLPAVVVVPDMGASRLLLMAAYLPVIARAVWHVARPGTRLSLRRIGRLEIVYSLVFLGFVVAAFRG